MSDLYCKSCSNSGRDLFGNACACGQTPFKTDAPDPAMELRLEELRKAVEIAKVKLNTLELKIKRVHPDAVIPSYANPGDAGLDLTVIDEGKDTFPETEPHIAYFYREYRTGLVMEIPPGHVGLIFPRSSQSKTGLILANCVGVIDSGYRGEVLFRFKADGAGNILAGAKSVKAYRKGDRAGQLIVMPIPTVRVTDIGEQEFTGTDRGTGGFGSTGQ